MPQPALAAGRLALQLTLSADWLEVTTMPASSQAPAVASAGGRDAAFFQRMYLTFGLLQGVDAYSTIVAVRGGAVEANPLLGGVARNPAALIGVKAAGSLVTIYFVEKLRRKNPVAASVTWQRLIRRMRWW